MVKIKANKEKPSKDLLKNVPVSTKKSVLLKKKAKLDKKLKEVGNAEKKKKSVKKNFVSAPPKEDFVEVVVSESKNESNPKKPLDISSLEEKYKIKKNDVKKAIDGVLKFATENPKLQNNLFSENIPLFLQVNSFKIPKGFSKVLRIPLANNILRPDDEICLIVADVKGFKNKEHDKHLEHYEELLNKKGVTNIKKIMTFHEFRTEYETFELRSRLVDLYDYFLVDGKISGKVVNKCGKLFYQKRKVPNPIKLHVTKLKEHIEQSLSKTQFNLTGHGDSSMVQFGTSLMSKHDLVQNVFSLIEGLDNLFPGKFENIRSLHVTSHRASSIPIYVSLKNPNDVKVPHIQPKLTKQQKKQKRAVKDELTTVIDAKVSVKADGSVKVIKTREEKDDPNFISIDDLLKDIKKMNDQEKEINKKGKKKESENDIKVVVEGEPGTKKRKVSGSEPDDKTPKKKNKKQKNKVENTENKGNTNNKQNVKTFKKKSKNQGNKTNDVENTENKGKTNNKQNKKKNTNKFEKKQGKLKLDQSSKKAKKNKV